MKRARFRSNLSLFLVSGVLPLYLLLSFSAILCSFHHPSERGIQGSHHHASQKPDPGQAADSALDFCKYAQSVSPVIFSAFEKNGVSFQPVAQAFLDLPSISSMENGEGIFLRGPPSLINL